jgi:hypothetical protein
VSGEALSAKLRAVDGGGVDFWCPGCKGSHRVWIAGDHGCVWGYNGNPERPTFTPSLLMRGGHYIPGHQGPSCWCTYNAQRIAEGKKPAFATCFVCHSFVTDGRIQFLGDCTHDLAGQTVDLPDWPTS